MKKIAFSALASLGAVIPALADGTVGGSANMPDTTVASDALEDMVGQVGTYLTAATPHLLTLLGGAVIITLVWVGWKLFRKGTNKVA